MDKHACARDPSKYNPLPQTHPLTTTTATPTIPATPPHQEAITLKTSEAITTIITALPRISCEITGTTEATIIITTDTTKPWALEAITMTGRIPDTTGRMTVTLQGSGTIIIRIGTAIAMVLTIMDSETLTIQSITTKETGTLTTIPMEII